MQCPIINFMSKTNYSIRAIADIISFGRIFSILSRRWTQWYNYVFTFKITGIIKKSKPRKQSFTWNVIIWGIYFYESWCSWPHFKNEDYWITIGELTKKSWAKFQSMSSKERRGKIIRQRIGCFFYHFLSGTCKGSNHLGIRCLTFKTVIVTSYQSKDRLLNHCLRPSLVLKPKSKL